MAIKKKLRRIKFKKERVILSDILPYEIPITFSNRYLYDFFIEHNIEIKKIAKRKWLITWCKNDIQLNEIIRILLGIRKENINNGFAQIDEKELRTIPFTFKISHKESDFRTLTMIHPKNQLELVWFYEKYKELIIYYSNLSNFSIRKPHKVAKFYYFKDKTHFDKNSNDQNTEKIEVIDEEFENLRSFFVYKHYSNIYKFYESYKYHRCEKKYNELLRFDLTKCFDSLYTHTITWALIRKDLVKDFLPQDKDTFGGIFDSIMQHLNYGETNGIVIGPEFSRIFAELILQIIDQKVSNNLRMKSFYQWKHYDIFRYVDDYFVFFNDPIIKENILQEYRLQLKEYKLYFNDSKTYTYTKPIITEITIAKLKISKLLNKYLKFNIGTIQDNSKSTDDEELINLKKYSIYVSSNKLITNFKTILKETNVEYKDILNYTLTLVERKMSSILKKYKSLPQDQQNPQALTSSLSEILDFTFFIYSVYPRVNTTIKLSRILRLITEFLSKSGLINVDLKHIIYKEVYDNIYLILEKNKASEYTQIETLYLLIALSELGKQYWLDLETLCNYVNIRLENQLITSEKKLNYFTIIVLLFYIKDKKRYSILKEFLKDTIMDKFNSSRKKSLSIDTELTFLLFDSISCPFLDFNFKERLLNLHNVQNKNISKKIINYRHNWFTNWHDFNFGKELDAKNSFEVYG